jgi:hypothetical protein
MTMADVRLIDANALDKMLVREYLMYNDVANTLTLVGTQVYNAAIDTARCKIREAYTIDAAPVVHGRWEYNPDDNIPYCNRCAMPQDVPTNYCASCGAKMDAKEE